MLAYNLEKKKKFNGASFNFGPKLSDKKKVIDVLNECKLHWKSAKWKKISKNRNSFKESKLLHLNINKIKKYLNWKNHLNFKDTINITISWYKNFYEKKLNVYNFSLNQIKYYQRKISKN